MQVSASPLVLKTQVHNAHIQELSDEGLVVLHNRLMQDRPVFVKNQFIRINGLQRV